MTKHDALGDRIKTYEAIESDRLIDPTLPTYIRLDGRSFSKFTKGMARPYDARLSYVMAEVTKYLVDETNADVGYTQSDEISLGWFPIEAPKQFLFGGKKQKLISTTAAMATAKFHQVCQAMGGDLAARAAEKLPAFDSRICQFPSDMELFNGIYWRQIDCTRNAVSMAARSMFSHKQLQNKDVRQMKELMLESGKDFDTFPHFFRKGSHFRRVSRLVRMINPRDGQEIEVTRSKVVRLRGIEWDSPKHQLDYFREAA